MTSCGQERFGNKGSISWRVSRISMIWKDMNTKLLLPPGQHWVPLTFRRTSYLLERYHIISLDTRYHTKSIFFVFRCIHNLCSSLFSDMFFLRGDCAHTDTCRVTRGQVNNSLSLPIVQSQAGSKSISFLGADRFNALPESLPTKS